MEPEQVLAPMPNAWLGLKNCYLQGLSCLQWKKVMGEHREVLQKGLF
jgi:hypothetical protein